MNKGFLLFLREQTPLLFIYIIQLAVITFVYWLGGFKNVSICLYAALLSGALFIGYMGYRYITHRRFYERLAGPVASIEEMIHTTEHAPLPESLQQLTLSHNRVYQTELLRIKEQLDQHIHFINQWVHQMKTPLSVLHLMNQEQDDEQSASMKDELDRMRKGLDMVLYAARLDSFEHDLYIESISLSTIVRSVTSEQKRLFIRNHVFPFVDIDPELIVVSDEKWLRFIITQLLTNAVKYSKGSSSKIHFRGFKQEDRFILSVEDEGIGIPKEDITRVFDPFFTGENGRTVQESTGMGLYLVKEVADRLGHEVKLESEQHKGTIVQLIFK
ncbi:sensor histidine kinase [Neobacillus mesonae]|nr:sensor histidine kinase [Neobacillus mesonae]